jgi:D-glycero-alpha-D-manno-heptose-7-phosphate kinase
MLEILTPLRVSFAGGSTDLPSFYRVHGEGAVVSVTIQHHIRTRLRDHCAPSIILRYMKTENVRHCEDIDHPIIKEVFRDYDMRNVELTLESDVPPGTGLGSSSAVAVGVLHAVQAYKMLPVKKEALAQQACDIEIKKLREPIGKQDQYAAAYGGVNFFTFHPDESVTVEPINISKENSELLQQKLILVYTGKSRKASSVLKTQDERNAAGKNTKHLKEMAKLAREMKHALADGDFNMFAEILNTNWRMKKDLSDGITDSAIDDMYNTAMRSGASAGKLLGAGGGGFMLFMCESERQHVLADSLKQTLWPVHFDLNGTRMLCREA